MQRKALPKLMTIARMVTVRKTQQTVVRTVVAPKARGHCRQKTHRKTHRETEMLSLRRLRLHEI